MMGFVGDTCWLGDRGQGRALNLASGTVGTGAPLAQRGLTGGATLQRLGRALRPLSLPHTVAPGGTPRQGQMGLVSDETRRARRSGAGSSGQPQSGPPGGGRKPWALGLCVCSSGNAGREAGARCPRSRHPYQGQRAFGPIWARASDPADWEVQEAGWGAQRDAPSQVPLEMHPLDPRRSLSCVLSSQTTAFDAGLCVSSRCGCWGALGLTTGRGPCSPAQEQSRG